MTDGVFVGTDVTKEGLPVSFENPAQPVSFTSQMLVVTHQRSFDAAVDPVQRKMHTASAKSWHHGYRSPRG
jgi:hypothetical protein